MTNCMPYCPTVPQAQNTSVRVVRTPLSPLTLCLSASVFPIFLRAAAPLEACGGVCRHPPIPATAHRRSSLVRIRTADPRPIAVRPLVFWCEGNESASGPLGYYYRHHPTPTANRHIITSWGHAAGRGGRHAAQSMRRSLCIELPPEIPDICSPLECLL